MRGRRLVSRKRQSGTETFSPPLPRRSPPAIRHPNRRPTAHVGLSADSRLPGTATRRRLVQAILGRRALPRTGWIRVSGVEPGHADQFERPFRIRREGVWRVPAHHRIGSSRTAPTPVPRVPFTADARTLFRCVSAPHETLRRRLFASCDSLRLGARGGLDHCHDPGLHSFRKCRP